MNFEKWTKRYSKYKKKCKLRKIKPKNYDNWFLWREKKRKKKAESNSKSRTLRDFVEDEISAGRTLNEILIVAQGSRWAGKKDEIKEMSNHFKHLKNISQK